MCQWQRKTIRQLMTSWLNAPTLQDASLSTAFQEGRSERQNVWELQDAMHCATFHLQYHCQETLILLHNCNGYRQQRTIRRIQQTLILKHCSVLSMHATTITLLTRLRPTGCDWSWNRSRPVLLPLQRIPREQSTSKANITYSTSRR